MSWPVSTIDLLQTALGDHLRDCAALAGIEIYDREEGDIDDAIANQLGSIGATIFISEVELGGVDGDLPNVSADDAQFTVVIFVNPTSNDSGRNAASLREYVMRRMHGFEPTTVEGIVGVGTVTLVPDPENGRQKKATNIRDITFRCSVTLEAGLE